MTRHRLGTFILGLLLVEGCSQIHSYHDFEDTLQTESTYNSYSLQRFRNYARSTKIRLQQNAQAQPGQFTSASAHRPIELEAVYKWIKYFSGPGRAGFKIWMRRAEVLQPMMAPIIEKYQLPEFIFYVAMVESGFLSHAESHKKASGAWQFQKSTAQHFGLKIDKWVDERRDPEKATHAAAKYLRALHTQFGDWPQALAAYNTGPASLRRIHRQTQLKCYWQIREAGYFSRETAEFVPKILAAATIASEAEFYGFKNLKPSSFVDFPKEKFRLKRTYRIKQLAKILKIKPYKLKAWNPELTKDSTPPIGPKTGRKSYAIRLPKRYQQKLNKKV